MRFHKIVLGGVIAVGLLVSAATPAQATARHRANKAELRKAAAVLMDSYDQSTAYWPSSWWNSAVATTTLIDYTRQTGDRTWAADIDHTFEVNKAAFPAGARSSDPILGNFESRAIDDTEWWGLAWIDAYDLTGNQKYLTEAKTIADYVAGYWDTATCGGGVWWNAEKTYKNSITNGLYVRLVASLHNRIPGDTAWLAKTVTSWNWFVNSGLINPDGLVNDGLTDSCQNNGQTVWTYNQGLAIGAGVEVYRATGNRSALTEAEHLADVGTTSSALVSNGILTESCDSLSASCDDNQKQFKGIFMRYLGDLNSISRGRYDSFIATQVNALQTLDRDAANTYGVRWSGQGNAEHPNVRDWRTQASALEALLAQSAPSTCRHHG